MVLDTLASRQRQVELFERYAPLLTGQQREVLELYLGSDWSLSEIARSRETSRAAVHDVVRRAAQALEEYEARLGLLRAESTRRDARAALVRDLADIRRRLLRIEQEVLKI
ncbi:MAG TPA: sigma factor-like helix-turn-helix DNA-binding protein [Candidatus Dormibacteraeota bacterium]|nr:sigma factor-like helix-turn-helix DNA-binding protein [Candidatus Dormibacteraeota bacterium]